jgi:hypothetical protein
MKRKFLEKIIFAGMFLFALNTSAAEEDAAKDEPKAEKPSVITVRQALTQSADYREKRVMLIGSFMGFNGSCDTAMPATRTDVMIQDKQGFCIWASGPLPGGFDPVSKLGLGEQIVLSGFVADPDDKPPFFQIPETKSAKQKAPSSSSVFIFSRAKDDRPPVITLEKALQTPDKYAGKRIALKGLYLAESAECGTPRPVIEGEDNPPLWTLKSKDDKCLWILGPLPGAAAGAETKTLVTIKGILAKRNNEFLFEISEPEAREPVKTGDTGEKTNKIKINEQK